MISSLPIIIAGFPVREATQDDLVKELNERLNSSKKTILLFANTNFVVKCKHLLEQLKNQNVLIVNDGLGLDIANFLLYRQKFKSNLNGTDFIPFFLKSSQCKFRIFLIGSSSSNLNKSADFLERQLGHSVVGSCDGYEGIRTTNNLVEIINSSSADVVLVALGNAQQEEWILNNYNQVNTKFFAGVGGLFDFWSGAKPRAPIWMQNIRMEWFYRLCLEPKRLYKRYTIDALKFLYICIKYRMRQGK